MNTHLDKLDLTGTLNLTAPSAAPTEANDAVLNLKVETSNKEGFLSIGGSGALTLAQANTLGQLGVDQDAVVTLDQLQTLVREHDTNVGEGADGTAETYGLSIIKGQLKGTSDSALLKVSSGAGIVFRTWQDEFNAPLELDGGLVVLDDYQGSFASADADSYKPFFSNGLTGTGGTLIVRGVKGEITGSINTTDGVNLQLWENADVLINKNEQDSINLTQIQVGEPDDADDKAMLTVNTTTPNIAETTDIKIGSGGTVLYNIDVSTKGVLDMKVGDLEGTGLLWVNLDLENGDSAGNHTIVFGQKDTESKFTGTLGISNAAYEFGSLSADTGRNTNVAAKVGLLEAGKDSIFVINLKVAFRTLKLGVVEDL